MSDHNSEIERLQKEVEALKRWAEAVSKQLGCDPPASGHGGPSTDTTTGGGGGPHEP